jgi:hypothetical protein
MQSVARAHQIVVGEVLYRKLSKGQKDIFEEAKFDKIRWGYNKSAEQKPYQLYIITL